jgi:hypothetical protein
MWIKIKVKSCGYAGIRTVKLEDLNLNAGTLAPRPPRLMTRTGLEQYISFSCVILKYKEQTSKNCGRAIHELFVSSSLYLVWTGCSGIILNCS